MPMNAYSSHNAKSRNTEYLPSPSSLCLDRILSLEHFIHFGQIVCSLDNRFRAARRRVPFLQMRFLSE